MLYRMMQFPTRREAVAFESGVLFVDSGMVSARLMEDDYYNEFIVVVQDRGADEADESIPGLHTRLVPVFENGDTDALRRALHFLYSSIGGEDEGENETAR